MLNSINNRAQTPNFGGGLKLKPDDVSRKLKNLIVSATKCKKQLNSAAEGAEVKVFGIGSTIKVAAYPKETVPGTTSRILMNELNPLKASTHIQKIKKADQLTPAQFNTRLYKAIKKAKQEALEQFGKPIAPSEKVKTLTKTEGVLA